MDEMRHMWWQEEPHKVVPVDQSMYKTKGFSGWQVDKLKNWIDWFKNDCWRRAHKTQTMEGGWSWQTAPMALTCMDALVNMWRQPPLNKPPVDFSIHAAWPCMKESCRVTQGRRASQIYGTVGNFSGFPVRSSSSRQALVCRGLLPIPLYEGLHCCCQDECSTWDVFSCESGQVGIKHMLGHHCGAQRPSLRDLIKVSWEPQWARLSKEMKLRFCPHHRATGAPWGQHGTCARILFSPWRDNHRQMTWCNHPVTGVTYLCLFQW